jgi:GDPmannose 4,6-dehydratase
MRSVLPKEIAGPTNAASRKYLVTGVSGQDGFHSARRFLRQGSKVAGLSRQTLDKSKPHVQLLARDPNFQFYSVPEYTHAGIQTLIRDIKPDRIVHCAGFRDLPSNDSEVAQCYFTNSELVDSLLKAIAESAPRARFLFISSAEIFGKPRSVVVDEDTPLDPQNHYAISKIQGMLRVTDFRTTKDVFAVSAICFNHDSFLSPAHHLVRLVPNRLSKLKSGQIEHLAFYNAEIRRDWSHAEDFAAAFELMLEENTPEDCIVASGKSVTLREYINLTCDLLGIDGNSNLTFETRESEDNYDRIACSDRIKQRLGWKPRISLSDLCREMIRYEQQ